MPRRCLWAGGVGWVCVGSLCFAQGSGFTAHASVRDCLTLQLGALARPHWRKQGSTHEIGRGMFCQSKHKRGKDFPLQVDQGFKSVRVQAGNQGMGLRVRRTLNFIFFRERSQKEEEEKNKPQNPKSLHFVVDFYLIIIIIIISPFFPPICRGRS